MWLFTLVACGEPEGAARPDPADAPAARDPFQRVGPEGIRATLDASFARCEGSRWVVQADVAGRADAVRAIVVRTDGEPLAVELDLARQEMPQDSVWERYADELPASAGTCDAARSATVLELLDADGAVKDCMAFGPGAARLVAGELDDRLGDVARGDWSACHVR